MTAQPSPLVSSPNPIDRLYRWATDDRVLGILLALLVLSVLAGVVLPQVPSTLTEPDAASRWLAETSVRYGAFGDILRSMGFFDLWHSVWLRTILAALAFALLLRLGLAVGEMARRLRQADPIADAAEARRWPLHTAVELAGDIPLAAAELSEALRSEGWRVTQAESDQSAVIVAERSPWGLVAPLLFYSGLLVALASLCLGQLTGWRESNVVLLPGRPVSLLHDSQVSIGLAGSDTQTGELVVQLGAGDVATRSLSPAGRARVGALTVHRTSQGQALAVGVFDQDGQALQLQSSDQSTSLQTSLDLVFDQPRWEQVFFVPARQLVVSVVSFPAMPERGFDGPTYLVQAFRTGRREPVFNQFVAGNADLTMADVVLQLRIGSMMIVEISRAPATPIALAGIALILVGLVLAIGRPTGRLVLSIRGAPEGVARNRAAGSKHAVSVDVSLWPSPVWRQAGRWLLAWTGTYTAHDSRDPQASRG